ncbi:MAG TPA: hypothetical protein VFO16_01995, partial [Pseudonocardiaceae bacterium]|nr:hypothetical protein [Pseudonocardiaceae bacterium]
GHLPPQTLVDGRSLWLSGHENGAVTSEMVPALIAASAGRQHSGARLARRVFHAVAGRLSDTAQDGALTLCQHPPQELAAV